MCSWFVEFILFFVFKQKTAYEMRISDWSSDVCSSDLISGPKPIHRVTKDGTLSSCICLTWQLVPTRYWHANRKVRATWLPACWVWIGSTPGRGSCCLSPVTTWAKAVLTFSASGRIYPG